MGNVLEIIKSIWPPNGTEESRHRWRVSIFISVVIIYLFISVGALWAMGVLPGSGFASKNELQRVHQNLEKIENSMSNLQETIKYFEMQSIRQSLWELSKERCNTIKNGNNQATDVFTRQIQELRERYRLISGNLPDSYTCYQ